ncbi:MAG: hypothetical protein ABR600_09180 [Actinomycetota bacterium]
MRRRKTIVVLLLGAVLGIMGTAEQATAAVRASDAHAAHRLHEGPTGPTPVSSSNYKKGSPNHAHRPINKPKVGAPPPPH